VSAIFGIINLKNEPVSLQVLQKMQSVMNYWGPNGQYLWNEENAGLGQLQLFNTPESVNEKFPLVDNEQGLVFISTGRIDNRNELLNLLNIPNELKFSITDAELIFDVYRKFDKDSVHKLIGDWSFAVWNKISRSFFLARDHHGATGIFYYQDLEYFIFSSSLKGILALPFVPKKINELRLAQILTAWPGDGIQTSYENILKLPPAHYLTLNIDGKTKKTRYWYLENTKSIKLNSDDEYVEAFGELFEEAIKCRLRSKKKIGISLSSGLDSSSIAALAANELKTTSGVKLTAFTSVPLFTNEKLVRKGFIADEGILATKTVQFNGNIEHILVNAETVSPFEGIIKTLSIQDEPVHAAVNSYWINAIMDKASELGIGTMLTGQGGNATISWPTFGYAYTDSLINIIKKPDKRKIRQFIIKNLFIKTILNYLNQILIGKQPYLNYSAINPDFAKRIDLPGLMHVSGHDPFFRHIDDMKKGQLSLLMSGMSVIGGLQQTRGAAFQINVTDPSADKRILEFTYAIPNEQFLNSNGSRLLLRRLMTGLLPEKVLWNSQRGRQAADFLVRLNNDKNTISQILLNFNKSEKINSLIDIPKLENKIASIERKITFSNQLAGLIARSIMVGLFVEKFEKNYN